MTISWDSVECIHRNGLITHYIISYGPIDDNSLATIETVNNNEPDDGGRFTATGILSTKIYFFKVVAVNAAGVGVFATVSQNKGTYKNVNLLLPLCMYLMFKCGDAH